MLFYIKSSFWPIPIVLSLIAILSAVGVIQLDAWQNSLPDEQHLFSMPAETARAILSSISGAMITIVSLVFSLTLVTLSFVSQQLGPRVLLRFKDDRSTQIVLGTIIATFLFALVSLMRSADEAVVGKSSSVSVLLASGLAVTSIVSIIHFIHHIATRIQADYLLRELGDDLCKSAHKHFKRIEASGVTASRQADQFLKTLSQYNAYQLCQTSSGYLAALDLQQVTKLAKSHGFVLRMKILPGDFALQSTCIAEIYSSNELDWDTLKKSLSEAFQWSVQRTPEASLEYEVNALAEVALRALSPSLNDPYTAMACVDRLAEGYYILCQRKTDQQVEVSEEGTLLVLFKPEPLARYVDLGFYQIARNGAEHVLVLDRIASRCRELRELCLQKEEERLFQYLERHCSDAIAALPLAEQYHS